MSYDHTKPNFDNGGSNVDWTCLLMMKSMVSLLMLSTKYKINRYDVVRRYMDRGTEAAYTETTRQLREKFPMGKLLIGNVLRASQFEGNYKNMPYLDGSYLENWREPNQLASTLQLMARALKEDYMIMLNADMTNTDFAEIDYLDGRYHLLNKPEFINFPLGFL